MSNDTARTSHVDGHPFSPPIHMPWGRCTVCKLGQAAHLDAGEPYSPSSRPAAPEKMPPARGWPREQGHA